MRTAHLTTWLLRGTYPRLFVPVVALIVVVTGIRYHDLLETETSEALQHAASELRRASDPLLPRLTAPLPPHTIAQMLTDSISLMAPEVASMKWQAGELPAIEVTAPAASAVAPGWFGEWIDLPAPIQQSGVALAGGASGRLTVTLHRQGLVDRVWTKVMVQARISALNIFTILFLLALLLRANARMLQRLAQATDAFRQGHLGTRMEVTGTLESRAMAEAFNDMAGKVQSLVLSLHETQRQQSEQLHFTRQLIDALPLPVFVRDANGIQIDANRAWQKLFQSPHGADAAVSVGARLPPELAPERSAHIASAHDNEIHIHPPHQPPLCMAYYEAPFTSTNGLRAGTIGTLVDVTERKRAQEALRAEKERAEVTLASIGDGVITTDLPGRITTINEAAQLMTGAPAAQALGRQLDDVLSLHDGPASRTVSMALRHNHPAGVLQRATHAVLIRPDGERYAIEYTASPIRESGGMAVGCVLVFRNVTANHQRLLQTS